MQILSLDGCWEMTRQNDSQVYAATVPGTVYTDLMANGLMDDPFYRDNEMDALSRMELDYHYQRRFSLTADQLRCDQLLLRFEGLDTLCQITLNGKPVLFADNMHRTWEADVLSLVREGENLLEVTIQSPLRFMRKAHEKQPIVGCVDNISGFPYLRKAHSMSGWDWGPRLPDGGIFRSVSLLAVRGGRLLSVLVRQRHEQERVSLTLQPETELCQGAKEALVVYRLTDPDGNLIYEGSSAQVQVENPRLWWPNGLGDQPLYTLEALLYVDGQLADQWKKRIGLRTVTVHREKDQWGEGFCAQVNGVRFFAMGADYIPQDNLLSRVTPQRTRRLLEDCKLAHFNFVRVWGGGYYPEDFFYDLCDELGLFVWQDFMFACALYDLTPEFAQNVTAEFRDNVRRLRHHASLALWCGNNEMELFTPEWCPPGKLRADYIRLYEYMIPMLLREMDPDTFYWPGSPSSGGGFDEPNDPDRGDTHYWDVWHGDKPMTEYRKFHFRFASEFGFQSFPCLKTVESFTLPEDRNIFSYVMEKHQRNNAANARIMSYMGKTYLYPNSFDVLLYASQLLQAEAMRYGVEHWRRNRGRCMGAIYWQLNDCWPTASWSSIDYFGRWKAVHYAAKRFFAPVLLSVEEEGTITQNPNVNAEPYPIQKSARMNVSNETMQPFSGMVRWSLRNPQGQVLQQGEYPVQVDALSAQWLPKLDFADAPLYDSYFAYELWTREGQVSSGTVLFCAPKHFHFVDPQLSFSVNGSEITITTKAYAKNVEIVCDDGDVLFSDNDFDMNAETRTVTILRGTGERFRLRSVYDIR